MNDTVSIPQMTLSPGQPIPRVIIGCWQLASGHGIIRPGNAIEHLCAFFEKGFTAFDCADIYTGVEELLGRFRAECKTRFGTASDRLRIHTKFVPDADTLASISKKDVRAVIHRSLRRLRVDRLDLVQMHWWDFGIPGYIEAAHYLAEVQEEGDICDIATTNVDTVHLKEIVESGIRLVSQQVQYSVLDRRPEKSLVQLAREKEFTLLCYGTAAGGFIADKYLGATEPTGHDDNRSLTKYSRIIKEIGDWDCFQRILSVLREVADKHHVSITNIATRYMLEQPQVGAIILGMRSAEHLADTCRMCALALDDEDLHAIRGVVGPGKELEGDVYGLERQKQGVHAKIMKTNLQRPSAR